MALYDKYETSSGKVLNKRTLDMWWEVEYLLGERIPITQGSYNKGGVAASAGVHDGGGAVDAPYSFGKFTSRQIVRALRRVGFAAWSREELWVNGKKVWPQHIHAVALGDKEASVQAKNQMSAYKAGFDGLGHLGRGGTDNGPREIVQTWEEYKAKHPKRFPKG